jgi:hypothetical protein
VQRWRREAAHGHRIRKGSPDSLSIACAAGNFPNVKSCQALQFFTIEHRLASAGVRRGADVQQQLKQQLCCFDRLPWIAARGVHASRAQGYRLNPKRRVPFHGPLERTNPFRKLPDHAAPISQRPNPHGRDPAVEAAEGIWQALHARVLTFREIDARFIKRRSKLAPLSRPGLDQAIARGPKRKYCLLRLSLSMATHLRALGRPRSHSGRAR